MNISKYLFLLLIFQLAFLPIAKAEDDHDHHSHNHQHESHATHEKEEDKGHEDHIGHDVHGHDEHEEGVLKLSPESREMIQLKTERVTRRSLGDRLKVYGQIARDTENYSHINFTGDGIVENVSVRLGDIVDEGDNLLVVRQKDGNPHTITSPSHGTVVAIYIKSGDKVARLKSLMSLVDMDLLRATIDVYEKDLRFIQIGQSVEFKSIAYPDKTFYGKVVFISPEIDEGSKSIKVRVDVENHDHLLKLGMSVSGEVIYHSDKDVLVVPKGAVQTLNNEAVVFIPVEGDEIRAQDVITGHTFDQLIEIKSGLKETDTVVTQGSFYLKSELEKEAFGDGHAH